MKEKNLKFVTVMIILTIVINQIVLGDQIDFTRDIRPILSDKCYACHGPDEKQRKADLRYDQRESVFTERNGYFIISPKDLENSELYKRITATDHRKMPPENSERFLTDVEIDLLTRWIENGANWTDHWAFIPPKRSDPPIVQNSEWTKNPIDHFILSKLEAKNLKPNSRADKRSLIRRATFDLTGLPPTRDEIRDFLADEDPNAYEKLIDRLLESPRYGEHVGRYWLDAARYGDTHGLHLDNYREMWPYRDWVINAFNKNMPFDQFVTEQIAGDLLPNPTLDQRVATGFNRCHVSTSEGGSIDEEYYVRYAVDRVNTTGTVFFGLTVGCAQCHDHKFDPITQKEFYQLFAFFNNITENAMDGNRKDPPPIVKVPSSDQAAQLADFDQQIADAETEIKRPIPSADAEQTEWEKTLTKWNVIDPQTFISQNGTTLEKLEDRSILASGETPDKEVYEIVTKIFTKGITTIRFEGLIDDSLPQKGAGRAPNSNVVLSEFEVEIAPIDQPENWQKIDFKKAWADYEQTNGDFKIANAIDGKIETGWAIGGHQRREDRQAIFLAKTPFGFENGSLLKIRLRHESQYAKHTFGRVRLAITDSQKFAEEPIIDLDDWHVIGPFKSNAETVYKDDFSIEGKPISLDQTYEIGDQKLSWKKRPELKDGQTHNLTGENSATYLYRKIHSDATRKIEFSFGSDDAIKVRLNGEEILAKDVKRAVAADQEIVSAELQSGENELLMKIVNYGGGYGFYFKLKIDPPIIPAKVVDTSKIVMANRTTEDQDQIRDYFRSNVSKDPELKNLKKKLNDLRKKQTDLDNSIPTTLVMNEREEPRGAYVLHRGEYDQRRDQVYPETPSALPPMSEELPKDRFGFSQWLLDPEQPLTSRVTINRFWQQLFGTGIVKTSENFGSQGEPPSHSDLLDWLAIEFIESGWDLKQMLKLMMTSATYLQSAEISAKKLMIDPQNRLLSRGVRHRLDAEEIRDGALAVSGLLHEKIGGASVKPPQPDGLWYAVGYTSSNTARFAKDTGSDKIYRRSLYTFWKRTAPPPQMNILDAPSRESCTVRRERTNTPLQALMLMNDPQYVEASRAFAERIIREGGESIETKITFAFELATTRLPKEIEMDLLIKNFNDQLETFRSKPELATELISIGETPPDENCDTVELAAWTMIGNLIFNLDEVLNKS